METTIEFEACDPRPAAPTATKYAIWHPAFASFLKPRQGWRPMFSEELGSATLYKHPHLAQRAKEWCERYGHTVSIVPISLNAKMESI